MVRHYDVCSKRCPGWSGWLPPDESIWKKFKAEVSEKSTVADSTTAAQAAGTASKVAVDGCWAKDTTTKAQQVFGTPVDGIVSG